MDSASLPFAGLLRLGAAGAGPAFVPDACTRVRHRRSACSACAAACPAGALSFADGRFLFDAARCTSCGCCAAACPAGALALPPDGADVRPGADGELRLARPGRLTVSLILRALASGVARIRVAVPAAQARLPWIPAACRRANGVLGALGGGGAVRLGETDAPAACRIVEEPAAAPGGAAAEPGADAPAPEFAYTKARGGMLPHALPQERAELLEAMAALEPGTGAGRDAGPFAGSAAADPGAPSLPPLPGEMFRSVSVDTDACISCRRCAAFCPTGALFPFHTKKGLIGIKQDVGACTACGLCEDICPKGALRLVPDVAAAQALGRDVRRIVMDPPAFEAGSPHAMGQAMRRLVTVDEFGEMI